MKIFLIGMPGAGKSTKGKLLAEALGLEFLDTDKWIEEHKSMSVPEIFENFGEPRFRLLENECLDKLLSKDDLVVACGGGMPCFLGNAEIMKMQGTMIYLKVELDTLLQRLKSDKKRPLLPVNDRKLHLEQLLKEREPYYNLAHEIWLEEEPLESIIRRINGLP